MRIEATKKGKDATSITLEFETGLDCERSVLLFNFECAAQYTATLLKEHLNKILKDTIEMIRKEEYDKGFKDGRGHKQQRDWFRRNFNLDQ